MVAFDSAGVVVAYYRSTGLKKDYNIFEVQGITGRHKTLVVVSICLSAFSVFALVGFARHEGWRSGSDQIFGFREFGIQSQFLCLLEFEGLKKKD